MAAPPVTRAAPAAAPTRTPETADGRTLRDEAWLVAGVVGAWSITFLPNAWIVVGRLSSDLLAFTLIIPLSWAICAALQIAALRSCRAGRFGRRSSTRVQFVAAAVVGVVCSVVFHRLFNPYTERLGLASRVGWGGDVVAAWSSVLLAAFLVWQREGEHRQALAEWRLRAVQQAQLAARRGLAESQLQAVQARVDPQLFFDTLDAIEALYRNDAARAEALFDELIAFLRAALPSLETASSTLARELDLAQSCARLHALSTGCEIALAIDAAPALQRLPFPSGVLLPLLRGVLSDGRQARHIDIDVGLRDGAPHGPALALTLTAPSEPDDETQQRVRSVLHALFGAAATLSCAPDGAARFITRLDIDHDGL